MSKRTPEEIIHSVERYQRGETSQGAEAKRLGVSKQTFQDWIRKYETFGEKVFRRTEKRRYSKELKLSAVQTYLNGEGSHAAICAAPTVFGELGLLKEKAACCYPGMEEQLNCKEAKFCSFVTDGNITTSRGVGTAIPFALELIRQLFGNEKASEIAESIVYKE